MARPATLPLLLSVGAALACGPLVGQPPTETDTDFVDTGPDEVELPDAPLVRLSLDVSSTAPGVNLMLTVVAARPLSSTRAALIYPHAVRPTVVRARDDGPFTEPVIEIPTPETLVDGAMNIDHIVVTEPTGATWTYARRPELGDGLWVDGTDAAGRVWTPSHVDVAPVGLTIAGGLPTTPTPAPALTLTADRTDVHPGDTVTFTLETDVDVDIATVVLFGVSSEATAIGGARTFEVPLVVPDAPTPLGQAVAPFVTLTASQSGHTWGYDGPVGDVGSYDAFVYDGGFDDGRGAPISPYVDTDTPRIYVTARE